jgi:hypothetical protein
MGVFAGGPSSVDVLVDVVGLYDDSTFDGGLRFTAITPTRIADTRSKLGGNTALGPNATKVFTAPGTVAGTDTIALATNLTAVNPTSGTYLTIWPAGVARPTVSNLNRPRARPCPTPR